MGCAIAATVVAVATPALAQQGDGLFGRSSLNPNSPQKLDLTASSTGQLDQDSGPSTLAGGQDSPGYSTMLESAADYAWRGRRAQLRATGTSAHRYFRPLDNLMPSSFGTIGQAGAVRFSARSRRNSITLNQTALYSSSPLYSLFAPSVTATPGDAPLAAPSYAIHSLKSYTYSTASSFVHELSARTALSATGDWQHTDTIGSGSSTQTLTMYGLGGQVLRRAGRGTMLTVGYVYRLGQMDDRPSLLPTRRMEEQGVDVGLDHRHPMSATRSVAFGGSVRAATVLLPRAQSGSAQTAAPAVGEHRFTEYSGQMTLGYQFARRWQVNAAYRQGVDYAPGVSEPVNKKSVSTSLVGLPASRVDILVSAAYSTGESAFSPSASAFDTYTGDARLRIALARTCAAYVEYLYYVYDSRGTLPLVPGLPGSLERNTIRVGLALRLPVL